MQLPNVLAEPNGGESYTASHLSLFEKQVDKASSLAIADKTLAASIKADMSKFPWSRDNDNNTHELCRCVLLRLETSLDALGNDDMKALQLG